MVLLWLHQVPFKKLTCHMPVVVIIILVVPNIASSDYKGVVEAIGLNCEALPGSGVNVFYSFRL